LAAEWRPPYPSSAGHGRAKASRWSWIRKAPVVSEAPGLFARDYVASHHDAFLAEVAPLVASGRLKYREDIRQGLENIPACFAEMLRGDNFGKMIVQVGADPTARGAAGAV